MKSVANMTELEKAQTRAWFKNWEKLGPRLEELRHKELREEKTVTSLAPFDALFRTSIRDCPPEPTSGLIEQQKLFAKGRR